MKCSPLGRISRLRGVLSFLVVVLFRQVAAGESPAGSGFVSSLSTDVLKSSAQRSSSFSRKLSQDEVSFSPNIPAGASSIHLGQDAAKLRVCESRDCQRNDLANSLSVT